MKSNLSPTPSSTEEPPPPEILNYTAYPPLRKIQLIKLIQERDELKQTRAGLDAQIKQLDATILPAMYQADAKAVLCGHYRISVIESMSSTLSKIRLLELGVSTDILEQATEKKPKAPYLQIIDLDRQKKEDE